MKKMSVLFMLCCACDAGLVPPANPTAGATAPTVETAPATSAQCPNGGTDIIVTSSDGTVKNVLVCDGGNGSNGADGTQGQNGATGAQGQTGATGAQGAQGEQGIQGQAASLPVFTETEANEEQCEGRGGTDLTVSSGGASESLVICNGVQGDKGDTGAGGAQGTGVVFTECPASTDQCPTGGYVLILASDTDGTGQFSFDDQNKESSIVCNGVQGIQGEQGIQGVTGNTGATGPQGTQGNTGATGATGAQGAPGTQGVAGTNGTNGKDGTNGTNGTNASMTPFTVVNAIAPCGNSSSSYKEQLLCLADGNILADFSKDDAGDDTRLAFIPAGNYQDTDSSDCNFSVCSDNHGGLTVSWAAQNHWAAGSYDCKNTVSTPQ